MSLDSNGSVKHVSEVELADSEIVESEKNSDLAKDLKDLSLERSEDLEKDETGAMAEDKTDESDGFIKKLGKLTCVIAKNRCSKQEEIEPYFATPETWKYSKYEAESVEKSKISIHIKHSSNEQKCVSETVNITKSDCYSFTCSKRGYLLLVINDKFYKQATRKGAHLDLLKMKSVAKKFGFQVLNKEAEANLTKSETMNWLRKAQEIDHSGCDCFMFMISTHGLEHPNPRKGGLADHALVCADDQLIFTSSIIEMFNDTNCPSLRGKPKIFIIQACRGSNVDHGGDLNIISNKDKQSSTVRDQKAKSDHPTHVHYDVLDTKSGKTHVRSDMPDTKAGQDSWVKDSLCDIETPYLKCDADMLVMYAIPGGMLAWRNTVDGSWMIHYLHEVLMEYDLKTPKSFLNVLTKVSAKMSQRTTDTPSFPEIHEKKAVPVIEHMLTQDILFSPKS